MMNNYQVSLVAYPVRTVERVLPVFQAVDDNDARASCLVGYDVIDGVEEGLVVRLERVNEDNSRVIIMENEH